MISRAVVRELCDVVADVMDMIDSDVCLKCKYGYVVEEVEGWIFNPYCFTGKELTERDLENVCRVLGEVRRVLADIVNKVIWRDVSGLASRLDKIRSKICTV